MAFTIRPAVKDDCLYIRELIQELADYEKYPEGPKITEKDLIEDGFGSRPFYHALVAEIQDGDCKKAVAYAIYFFIYSTWEGRAIYMEDLFVSQPHRNKGIGSRLWKAVAKEGLKNGCSRLDFAVLSWNTPSIEFYESKGAFNLTTSQKWNLFRLPKEAMDKLCSS